MKKTNLYTTVLAGALGVIGVITLAFKLTAADSGVPAGGSEPATVNPVLTRPVKSVFDHYLTIQADLANDTLTGVAENASAMTKVIEGDSQKSLSTAVAIEAEALAQANDLATARAAFKPLSDDLIKFLADHQAKSAYVQVYCPMARANWLQGDKTVRNPYFGSAMSGCGVVQE